MVIDTICVPVKHVPVGGAPLRVAEGALTRDGVSHGIDAVNEIALEWAIQQREAGVCRRVVALCAGPADAADTLRRAAAVGADELVHVCDDALAGSDVRLTARVLAAAIATIGADVTVLGYESADGSSGVIPSAVATLASRPLISRARTAVVADGAITAERDLGRGAERIRATIPCVVSVVEGGVTPRFPSLRDTLRARSVPIQVLPAADLDVDPAAERPHRAARLVPTPLPARDPVVVGEAEAVDAILALLADAGVMTRA